MMISAVRLVLLVLVVGSSACSTRERAEQCMFGDETADYQACDSRDGREDCEEPLACMSLEWRFGSGAICTRACDSELDCPSWGSHQARCLDVEGAGRFLCYQSCGRDADCDGGHVCQPLLEGGSVCLP